MESPQRAPLDRYVVLEYLAEGGMGAIYLGKKLGAGGFEKRVVLKQLLPEFTSQPEFIDLFLREARLSATLDHANIIHTIDLVTAGDEHFIVMEYLEGADLRTLLKKSKQRGNRISPAAGIYVAKELLSALSYAHNKHDSNNKPLRLIHRDISPSNILISGNGEVKLTDFGIAKAATHNSVFYRVKGKVGYMSPEQARSQTLDARSDLYSMAVCLYETITGERLLVTTGLATSADQLYSTPIPRISQKVPGLPTELDEVMHRALAVDADRRYQTAGEFQEALLACAHRHGLMMSAPELASYLTDCCGSHENWRREDDDDIRRSTEIYEHNNRLHGTKPLDSEEVMNGYAVDSFIAIDTGYVNPHDHRRERAKTSMSLLIDLQGIELRSTTQLGEDHNSNSYPDLDLTGLFPTNAPDVDQLRKTAQPVVGPPPSLSPPSPAPALSPTRQPAGAYSIEDTGVIVGTSADPQHRAQTASLSRPKEEAPRSGRNWLLVSVIMILSLLLAAAVGLTGPDLDITVPSGNEFSSLP